MGRAYQKVREELLQLERPTGRELSRHKLAAKLGLSAGSVRAALDRLEAEGLLEVRPKSGTQIRQVDSTEYHEIHDLRELIEPYAARRAAWWITPPQLERLWACCRGQEKLLAIFEKDIQTAYQPKYFDKSQALNRTFHETILEAAQNPTAARIVDNLRMLSLVGFFAGQHPPAVVLENVRQSTRQERAIVEAIRDGDGDEAERRMRVHIQSARNRTSAGLPLAEQRILHSD
jgi:DNA-binding GntR family transcriptional regulator